VNLITGRKKKEETTGNVGGKKNMDKTNVYGDKTDPHGEERRVRVHLTKVERGRVVGGKKNIRVGGSKAKKRGEKSQRNKKRKQSSWKKATGPKLKETKTEGINRSWWLKKPPRGG